MRQEEAGPGSASLATSELPRLMVDSATECALVASDRSGQVTYWNSGAQRLFGFAAADMLGRDLGPTMTADDQDRGLLQSEMDQARAQGRVLVERWQVRRDGTRFWGSGLMLPLMAPASGYIRIVRDCTDRKLAHDRLRADEVRYRTLATAIPQLVFGGSGTGERTVSCPRWSDYTGLSEPDSAGFGWLQAIHPEDRDATLRSWTEAGAKGDYLVEHRIRAAGGGDYRWHQTCAVPLPKPLDGGTEWVGSSTDVDQVLRLRDRLALAEQELRRLVDGVPQLLWRSCDKGQWTWASPQWCDFTGLEQQRNHGRGWLEAVHPDDRGPTMAAWEAARAHGMLDVEFRVRRAADGAYLWHRTRSTPVRDEGGRIVEWLGTTTDIQDLKDHAIKLEIEVRERERAEARLLHTAFHDDLTGLHSRAYFMDRLKLALDSQARTPEIRPFVLFMDLDGFKLVNDSLGHVVGDRLLVEVAHRLQACTRQHDTLARLGGDEFAVLVDTGQGRAASDFATAIIEAMRRPVLLEQRQIFASGSIGLVEVTSRHRLPEEVLRDADIAMYHAKRHNTGGYQIFTESMRDLAVEALELRTELRNAVAGREFALHYQPICDARTRAILGVEALLRWRHPRHGLVAPGEFIATAEDTGLIRQIGRWVLGQACEQLGLWRTRFPGIDLRLSVNASGEELQDPDYLAQIRETLGQAGLEPRALQIEVTESVFLRQAEMVGQHLQALRAQGVRIALDDFGTGYCSLSYLDTYDIDVIKIDQSFVSRMLQQAKTNAIVRTIIALGRGMGLDIVAEGVESDEQLTFLREAGCGLVQGYLLGRPMPPDEIGRLLDAQARPD